MDKTSDLLVGPAENLESEIGGDKLHLLRWENLPVASSLATEAISSQLSAFSI